MMPRTVMSQVDLCPSGPTFQAIMVPLLSTMTSGTSVDARKRYPRSLSSRNRTLRGSTASGVVLVEVEGGTIDWEGTESVGDAVGDIPQ